MLKLGRFQFMADKINGTFYLLPSVEYHRVSKSLQFCFLNLSLSISRD